MNSTVINPGRLPNATTHLIDATYVALPQQFMELLELRPLDYVRVTIASDEAVIIMKAESQERPYCTKLDLVNSALRINGAGRITLPRRYRERMQLEDSAPLIIYLDEVRRRLVLQKYSLVKSAQDCLGGLYTLLREETLNGTLTNGFEILRHLEAAEKLIREGTAKKATQRTRAIS